MSKIKTRGKPSINRVTQAIIKKREKEYYHLLFTEKASNPKEVFNITNALLVRITSVLCLNVHLLWNLLMTLTIFC